MSSTKTLTSDQIAQLEELLNDFRKDKHPATNLVLDTVFEELKREQYPASQYYKYLTEYREIKGEKHD